MANPAANSALAIIRHTPYGNSLARTAIDVSLANAAFDQPVELLFMGDGVLQLLPAQDTTALGRKNLARLLASLPLYGIEQVYADAEAAALHRVDLEQSPVATMPLEAAAMRALLHKHAHLLGF